MISIEEVLSGNKYEDLTPEQQANIQALLIKLNKVRERYARPLKISSGFRTKEHHIQIYENIAKEKGIDFDITKVPMQSKHLFGEAADLIPNDVQDFKLWCLDHDDFLRSLGVWMEAFSTTKTWVHMQSVPYGSFKEGEDLQFYP